MSVALLTARELGQFVAIAHKHLECTNFFEMVKIAAFVSSGNAGAYHAQYNEDIPSVAEEAIKSEAYDYLNGRRDMIADHWVPIVYNMISNDGLAWTAPMVPMPEGQGNRLLILLKELETRARRWQEGHQREQKRAEQNAAAFDDIGQLLTLTREDITARMEAAGCSRVIIAEFKVDESDSQSDYWGGRTAREIVIGFGKGKRESFKQLREAAGNFPPTAHMGPGKDIYTARVILTDSVQSNGSAYWQGSPSHWHSDIGHDTQFSTLAEAEAFIAEKGQPDTIHFDGQPVRFEWKITRGSYEHRENYSMGGGNYLGTSRYSGWKVRSTSHVYEGMEFFQPAKPAKQTKSGRKTTKTTKPPVAPATEPLPEQPDINLADIDVLAWL